MYAVIEISVKRVCRPVARDLRDDQQTRAGEFVELPDMTVLGDRGIRNVIGIHERLAGVCDRQLDVAGEYRI
ncbi:hypothetical protein [Paraburkholderia sp. RL17-347-BIC-D]|uniref:hypothetical protein n=1 Tax=Paraburkholderia sp. RL17-347-BIC-D TaxID=3031632 RepID=UPI0038BA669B